MTNQLNLLYVVILYHFDYAHVCWAYSYKIYRWNGIYEFRLINLNIEDDNISDKIGHFFVHALPKVIKALSVLGTIALLLVSSGIFVHNIDFFHHLLPNVPSMLVEFGVGLAVGFIALLLFMVFKKVFF